MGSLDVRTVTVALTEVHRESGARVEPPTRKVVAAAAIANPLAGKPLQADLSELEQLGADVAAFLVERALQVLA